MLDGHVRRWIDPWLDRAGRALAGYGFTANTVTVTGFLIGVAAAAAIVLDAYAAAFVLIGLSRICDGLDGAVARATQKTDFGGFPRYRARFCLLWPHPVRLHFCRSL